jgi:uncharacterized membrane protein YobD (UPF0266 family)
MDWLALGGFLFGTVILSYALKSKTIALQPSQRGLLIGTGLALIAGACWITLPGLDSGLGSKDILSFLFIFLSILLYGSMVTSVYLRKTAGPLLFDVPRPRSRKVSGYITSALFVLLIALTFLTTSISRDVVIEVFFYFAVVLYFALPFFGKVELRAEGIIETYTLYRWINISSYQWVGQNESNLLIILKAPWRKTTIITLPPNQKESMDGILKVQIGRSL